MTPLLSMLAALATPARAAPGLTGSEGIYAVPAPETVIEGQATLAAGMSTSVATTGTRATGFPVGVAVGLSDRFSVGLHLQPYDASLASAPFATTMFTARMRVRDPIDQRIAVAVEAEAGALTLNPRAGVRGIAGRDLGRLSPTVALGARYEANGGLGGTLGAGLSVDLRRDVEALAESAAEVDARGISQWTARAGARGLAGPLLVSAWGGGGQFEAIPWFGFGVSLGLTSVDLRQHDRDADGVSDRQDACVYRPEDLDGWQDQDGCADPDNDGDGILDADDPTPDGETETTVEVRGYTTLQPRFRLAIPTVALPGPAAAASAPRLSRDDDTEAPGGDAPAPEDSP